MNFLGLLSKERRILAKFSKELDKIERKVPMLHGYARQKPYVIEKAQGGHSFKFIIYHDESKAWFDTAHDDAILVDIDNNKLLQSGDVCFDLGCNSGFMSTAFAKRIGPAGRVIGFDPYPWNALATKYNAIINDLGNVEAFAIGVGKEEATIKLSAADSKTIHNENQGFDAQILPLSAFANYRPTFIKIDIEGAEADVAEIPFSRVSDRLRIVALEFHSQFIEMRGIKPADVLRKFEGQGLEIRKNRSNGPIANPETDADAHYFVMRTTAH